MDIEKEIIGWLNANVHDGEDRSGTKDALMFSPDTLSELVVECFEYCVKDRLTAAESAIIEAGHMFVRSQTGYEAQLQTWKDRCSEFRVERDQLRAQLAEQSVEISGGGEPFDDLPDLIVGAEDFMEDLATLKAGTRLYAKPSPNKADVPDSVRHNLDLVASRLSDILGETVNTYIGNWCDEAIVCVEAALNALPPLKDESI